MNGSTFAFFLFLSVLETISAVTVTVPEQYACVMRAEEYVDWNNDVGLQSSLFIGLMHIAVTNLVPPTIETLVWHQVGFAVNITIDGPADAGSAPNPRSLLPLLTLASTNAAAGATNCPITGTWIVDDFFLASLRTSKLYCQIESGTNTGNLRGQIYSKYTVGGTKYMRESFVAFMGAGAQDGMGIFRAHKVQSNTPTKYVYLDYWILSRSLSTSALPQAIAAGNGYLPVALFPHNGSVTQDNSMPARLWVTEPGQGPVVPESLAFSASPVYGPGSSGLILSSIEFQVVNTYTQFYRLAYYTDWVAVNETIVIKPVDRTFEDIVIAVLIAGAAGAAALFIYTLQ